MSTTSGIHNIRTDVPITRGRLKKMTMSILDGPPASGDTKDSKCNAAIAYLLMRDVISKEDGNSYCKKHGLKKSILEHWKAEMDAGHVSYVDGKFIATEVKPKRRMTEARKAFDAVIPYIDKIVERVGVVYPDTVLRMMYAKKQDPTLEGDKVFLQALVLAFPAGGCDEPWDALASLQTVEKMLKEHGLAKQKVVYRKGAALNTTEYDEDCEEDDW